MGGEDHRADHHTDGAQDGDHIGGHPARTNARPIGSNAARTPLLNAPKIFAIAVESL